MATVVKGDYDQFGTYSLEDVGRLYARAAAGDPAARAAYMGLRKADPGAASMAKHVVDVSIPAITKSRKPKRKKYKSPAKLVKQARSGGYDGLVALATLQSRADGFTKSAGSFPSRSAYLQAVYEMELD